MTHTSQGIARFKHVNVSVPSDHAGEPTFWPASLQYPMTVPSICRFPCPRSPERPCESLRLCQDMHFGKFAQVAVMEESLWHELPGYDLNMFHVCTALTNWWRGCLSRVTTVPYRSGHRIWLVRLGSRISKHSVGWTWSNYVELCG